MALACLAATVVLIWPARALQRMQQVAAAPGASSTAHSRFGWWPFAPALAAYTLFGVGYIGYMTFVVALLREQGEGPARITWFYALLGLAVLASSRIWAGLLDRFRGGEALAILNGLLAIATVVPALTAAWPLVLLSGLVFGGVFLSVVASTTALVRHNLPARRLADRYQRLHHRVRGRPDRRSHGDRVDRRRPGRAGARPGVLGRGVGAGFGAGLAAAAAQLAARRPARVGRL